MSNTATSLMIQRWDWIDDNREKIVLALNQLAKGMPNRDRKLLKDLSGWFANHATYEQAILRPDVLAICAPLVRASAEGDSQSKIDQAVRIGFSSVVRSQSTRGRVTDLVLYPALLLVAMAAITVFFSVLIIPHFQFMFAEFGIELSDATKFVLKFAMLVKSVWLVVVVVFTLLGAVALLMNFVSRQNLAAGESWLDQQLRSPRVKVANWAWHMATLLDSGFSVQESVGIAGNAQRRGWLNQACRQWASSDGSKTNELFDGRFRLMETTLQVENHDAQISLFREAATYYWSRNRMIFEWWSRWFVSLLFWLFFSVVVICVFALLGPVFAVTTGVSGGIW